MVFSVQGTLKFIADNWNPRVFQLFLNTAWAVLIFLCLFVPKVSVPWIRCFFSWFFQEPIFPGKFKIEKSLRTHILSPPKMMVGGYFYFLKWDIRSFSGGVTFFFEISEKNTATAAVDPTTP